MSSKRKTPARKKTTPAATLSVSDTSAAPIEAPAPEMISAPAVAPAPSAPVAVVSTPVAVVPVPAPVAVVSAPVAAIPAPARLSSTRLPPARRFASHEERHRTIAKIAYGYAERAGFRNNPVEDWLMAEREVDATLERLAS